MASSGRGFYRILFATEGARSQVLLALTALNTKTQKTPASEIDLAEAC
jgi:phage-related protein